MWSLQTINYLNQEVVRTRESGGTIHDAYAKAGILMPTVQGRNAVDRINNERKNLEQVTRLTYNE
jgi:hypothetical protein